MSVEANDVGFDACSATPCVCVSATTNQQGCSLMLKYRGRRRRGPIKDGIAGRVLHGHGGKCDAIVADCDP